jgi:serine/threonine protein kinase
LIGFIVYNCRRGRNDRYMLIPDGDMEPGRELQVDISEISIREKIGRGSFGDIYVGEWRGVEVAVKKIAYAHMSEKFIQELWREAHLMKFVPSIYLVSFSSVRSLMIAPSQKHETSQHYSTLWSMH